jgi:hypothetical protein
VAGLSKTWFMVEAISKVLAPGLTALVVEEELRGSICAQGSKERFSCGRDADSPAKNGVSRILVLKSQTCQD